MLLFDCTGMKHILKEFLTKFAKKEIGFGLK